jgi:hypothetical protein
MVQIIEVLLSLLSLLSYPQHVLLERDKTVTSLLQLHNMFTFLVDGVCELIMLCLSHLQLLLV